MATAGQSSRSKDTKSSNADTAELEAQIAQLQKDVAAIGASLAGLGEKKASEARGEAEKRYNEALETGRRAATEVTERARHYESDLENTIREKPLAAVAGALGIGFLAALLMKR